MRVEKVNDDTRTKLVELAAWLSHANELKKEPGTDNVWQCVDKGQCSSTVGALLETLDLKIKVNSFAYN